MAMQHHHLALLAGRLPCPKQLALAQCGGQQVCPLVADEGHGVALLALADSDDQLIVGLRTGGNVHELAVGPLQGGGREDSAAVAPPTAVMSPPTDLVGHLLILRIPCGDALRANSKQALESNNMGGEGGEGDRREGEGGEGGAGEVRSRRVTKHPPRPAFFLYSYVHMNLHDLSTHTHTRTHTHTHTHTRTHTHTCRGCICSRDSCSSTAAAQGRRLRPPHTLIGRVGRAAWLDWGGRTCRGACASWW